jgi:hypothetical protein
LVGFERLLVELGFEVWIGDPLTNVRLEDPIVRKMKFLSGISRLTLLCTSCVFVASGRSPQVQTEKLPYAVDRANVPDAIAKVKSGEFRAVHVDLIARASAIEGIPALKDQFDRVRDPLLKDKIAAALLRLGEKDDKYWEFLVNEAKAALESNTPNFVSYDSEGKAVSAPSPEFEAWLQTSGTSDESAMDDSMYLLPGRVALLGWSGDPRAVLPSPRIIFAKLHDSDSSLKRFGGDRRREFDPSYY